MRISALCIAIAMTGLSHSAIAQSKVVLSLAGEAYEGAPTFEVLMGDRLVGTGTVEVAIDTVEEGRIFGAKEPHRHVQHFSFSIPDADFDANAGITVLLTNDRYLDTGHGYDRNIFIEYIDVNGVRANGEDIRIIEYGFIDVDVPLFMGMRPVYGSGQRAVLAAPTVIGWPMPSPAATTHITAIPTPRPQF